MTGGGQPARQVEASGHDRWKSASTTGGGQPARQVEVSHHGLLSLKIEVLSQQLTTTA